MPDLKKKETKKKLGIFIYFSVYLLVLLPSPLPAPPETDDIVQ